MLEKYCLCLSQGEEYPYIIVRSARAKYVRLKLSKAGLLSLVLPHGAALKYGHAFIQSKITWIEKQLKNIEIVSDDLPDSLDLVLLKEQWKIEYIEEDIQHVYLNEENNILTIKGLIADKALVNRLINKWCQYKAKPIFSEMLESLAVEHGFRYRRLTIRSQKTRWGSCSQNKNINLNSKLLLFKKEIVEHVMIHELCHTLELNHSKRFWKLVENCDPDYLLNRAQLKELEKTVVL